MGLNQSEKRTYCSFLNGKVAIKAAAETPGAVETKNKDGEKKYYLMYRSISGFLHKISYRPPPENHTEWAWQWNIVLKDGTDFYNVNMPFGSDYARAFFCILPNIDLTKEIEMIPTMKTEVYEGKQRDKRGLFIKQSDEILQWYYKKDNNEDLPEVEITKTKSGKVIYDDTERNDFFKKLTGEINDKLAVLHSQREIINTESGKDVLYENSRLQEKFEDSEKRLTDNSDDLPF